MDEIVRFETHVKEEGEYPFFRIKQLVGFVKAAKGNQLLVYIPQKGFWVIDKGDILGGGK